MGSPKAETVLALRPPPLTHSQETHEEGQLVALTLGSQLEALHQQETDTADPERQ